MEISKVGVVVCGLMGAGIAPVCALSGFNTVVRETQQVYLDRGFAHAVLNRHRATSRINDLADSDLISNAIGEHLDTKRALDTQSDALCFPHATHLQDSIPDDQHHGRLIVHHGSAVVHHTDTTYEL